jgi:hypothetical protein
MKPSLQGFHTTDHEAAAVFVYEPSPQTTP